MKSAEAKKNHSMDVVSPQSEGPAKNMPSSVKNMVDQVQRNMNRGKTLKEAVDPATLKKEAKKRQFEELLSGQREAPNEFAGYLVAQLRETMRAGGVLAQQIKTTRLQLEQMEQEALRMEGAAEQHLRDLEQWDKPLATASPAGEDPPVEETSNEQPPVDE